jgi:polo-like kinase 4
LQPVRHRTKNAILSILASGEVVVEFVKHRSQGEEKVVDVCRISADGIRVRFFFFFLIL